MNLRHLKTIIAISEHSTFLAASESLALSHSAVSLHIKALEEELQVNLVDRKHRPPILTDHGIALVERARKMIDLLDEIATLGQGDSLVGSLTLGVVPSVMTNLLPPALAQLRTTHPKLQIRVKTGLSGDLTQQLRSRDIDVALVTAPKLPLEGLLSHEITREQLYVIAPASTQGETDEALLKAHPFIWFNRKTWAGQQIEDHLIKRGISVQGTMEVDSLEAIEALAQHELGVSIVPLRAGAQQFSEAVRVLPFGQPQAERVLTMVERPRNPKTMLAEALLLELRKASNN